MYDFQVSDLNVYENILFLEHKKLDQPDTSTWKHCSEEEPGTCHQGRTKDRN
jgi:hypothetical protein